MKVLPSANKQPKVNNLQQTFRTMLILAQCFGYFPVRGITGPDYHSLKFTWKSFRILYAAMTIFGAVFVTIFQLHKIFTRGFDLSEANRLFFNLSGVTGGYLFLKLAKNWSNFMKDWSCIDMTMARYGWPKRLNKTLNYLLIVFMLLAFVEYILGQSSKLYLAIECKKNWADGFNYFFSTLSYSHIYSLMAYDIVSALILQGINIQLCFLWTFVDVFIMILSTTLAARFQQITDKIQSVVESNIDVEIVWKNLRDDYNRLCRFCRRLDEEVSYIVLLTFASDLFFILVQLFNSLKTMTNDVERVYFYFSFAFLISRTISLCLYGAKVNDESKKPMMILNSVSSKMYNFEIQRFIQQIGTTEVAITGRNFFTITRGLILSIAGAIVTYELVLIQFNDFLLKGSSNNNHSCPVLA